MTSRDDDGGVDPRIVRTRHDILGATLQVLAHEGWDAVTHQRVAQVAGYSRATVYKHWPRRPDLVRDAFVRLHDLPHHRPTGDLRADLVRELSLFRQVIVDRRMDRALCVFVELTDTVPDLAGVRSGLVGDGEHVVRAMLAPHFHGPELEAAVLMLGGAVLYGAMTTGTPPDDAVIEAAVDLVLRALGR